MASDNFYMNKKEMFKLVGDLCTDILWETYQIKPNSIPAITYKFKDCLFYIQLSWLSNKTKHEESNTLFFQYCINPFDLEYIKNKTSYINHIKEIFLNQIK